MKVEEINDEIRGQMRHAFKAKDEAEAYDLAKRISSPKDGWNANANIRDDGWYVSLAVNVGPQLS